jgi:hypothetical protein
MLAKLLLIGAITLPEYEARVHRGNFIERENRVLYKEAPQKPMNAPNPAKPHFEKSAPAHKSVPV